MDELKDSSQYYFRLSGELILSLICEVLKISTETYEQSSNRGLADKITLIFLGDVLQIQFHTPCNMSGV